MLKKIALIGIFALASVASFGQSSNASQNTPSVRAPAMKSLCWCFKC